MPKNIYITLIVMFLLPLPALISQNDVTGDKEVDDNTSINDINYGLLIDSRDNKTYKTVIIGNQTWTAENMAYLPVVSPEKQVSENYPVYYVYGYDGKDVNDAEKSDNFKNYGVLYNWESAKLACPKGWHLPSGNDWERIINYLGHVSVVGNKMKATGTLYWKFTDEKVTNLSGFDALPGGSVTPLIGGENITMKANFWGTDIRTSSTVSTKSFSANSSWAGGSFFSRSSGLSVRCLKN